MCFVVFIASDKKGFIFGILHDCVPYSMFIEVIYKDIFKGFFIKLHWC